MIPHPTGFDAFFLLRDAIGPGSFVCRAHTEIGDGWWHLRNPRRTLTAWKHADVVPLLREMEDWVSQGGYAASYVAYEASTAFDPAMAVHPPMLYTGYVGFSVAFAFAVAALLKGRLDSEWVRWARPWTIAAWVFLTIGIALGSWWA